MANILSKREIITRKRKLSALGIAAIYAFVGGVWILFSDRTLATVAADSDMLTLMQTFKGWFFVFATAWMLYALVNKSMAAFQLSQEALRESEERFCRLIERAADGLILNDMDGNIHNVNQAACDTLGYTRQELLKLNIADIMESLPFEDIKETWRQLPDTGPVTMLGTNRRKDGSIFPVEVRIGAFDSNNDQLVLALVRDITERKQAEEEIRHRQERELEIHAEAEEAKKQFYKGTIFSVTDGRLNLVSYEEIDALITPKAQNITLESGSNLSSLRKAVAEIASNAGMAEDRMHSLIIAVGEASANAIKHANGGLVRIGIKDNKVQVCIQDNGPGMDSLILPKATLLKGFSTKPSMGLGYSLILSLVDTTYLATEKQGTWVLMEMYIEEPEHEISLDAMPDNW